jgi:hypothetical protein
MIVVLLTPMLCLKTMYAEKSNVVDKRGCVTITWSSEIVEILSGGCVAVSSPVGNMSVGDWVSLVSSSVRRRPRLRLDQWDQNRERS